MLILYSFSFELIIVEIRCDILETAIQMSRARDHMKISSAASGDTQLQRNAGPKGADKVTRGNELKGTHRAVGIPPRFSSLQP